MAQVWCGLNFWPESLRTGIIILWVTESPSHPSSGKGLEQTHIGMDPEHPKHFPTYFLHWQSHSAVFLLPFIAPWFKQARKHENDLCVGEGVQASCISHRWTSSQWLSCLSWIKSICLISPSDSFPRHFWEAQEPFYCRVEMLWERTYITTGHRKHPHSNPKAYINTLGTFPIAQLSEPLHQLR